MSCGCTPSYIGPSLATTCYGNTFVLFMSLLNTIINNHCEISDICQRITPTLRPDPEYDFVVIGGGSAGSVVAARLSEVPQWKVLLIEAGGDEPSGTQLPSMMNNFHGTSIDWNFKTEPQKNACLGYPGKRCIWPRGKVLGGCGVINGMMYMRGLPEDYDDWRVENWRYEDVLEYFKAAEGNVEIGSLVSREEHGEMGPMTTSMFPHRPDLADDVLKAAQEAGFPVVNDLNAPPYWGFTIAQANHRNGSRLSPARAYLRPARDRPNLHVMLNTTATKVLFTKENVASGVEFLFNNHSYTVNTNKEVILSAGAIQSPQILLLSGIGPNQELSRLGIPTIHNLPGVGKNLQNHVSFVLNYELHRRPAINDLDWFSADRYFEYRASPLASTGMSQVTGRISSKYAMTTRRPDLQFFFNGYLADCSRFGMVGERTYPTCPSAGKLFQIVPVALRPKSRGSITLRTTNPLSPPRMDPNYLDSDEDLNVLVEGVRVAQRLANTTVLTRTYGAKLRRDNYGNCSTIFSYDSDEFWKCAIRYSTAPENHQCCSCKMGPSSDPLAVVNSELQVHGIAGVRVMDASIMPLVVPGNTQATVVMIAEKGAALVKKRWLGA